MNIRLVEKKITLISLLILLFIVVNTILIYKMEQVDRTVLISEPHITQKGTLKETLKTEGEVEPFNTYKVFYEESKGTLGEILVEEGQEVQSGTPLIHYIAENDNEAMVTELEEANQRLATKKDKLAEDLSQLQAEVDEYSNLPIDNESEDGEQQILIDPTRILNYEMKNIEYEIKMIDLQMEENQTKIDIAGKNDEPIPIESKIDGIVVWKDEFARTPDQPLITIVAKDPLLVDVLVSESNIQRVKVNQEVMVRATHIDDKEIKGKVVRISDIPSKENVKEDMSYYIVTIQVDETEETDEKVEAGNEDQLPIGAHVDADITLQAISNVVILPQKSLAGNRLIAIEKGRLVQKKVTAGMKTDGKVAITKGLKEGLRILPKADLSIKGDTKYIKRVDLRAVNKAAYRQFKVEEELWLLARGIVQ